MDTSKGKEVHPITEELLANYWQFCIAGKLEPTFKGFCDWLWAD